MKVTLYQVYHPEVKRRRQFGKAVPVRPARFETFILEENGTPDGKEIACVRDHEMARQIVKAMGWELVEDNVAKVG